MLVPISFGVRSLNKSAEGDFNPRFGWNRINDHTSVVIVVYQPYRSPGACLIPLIAGPAVDNTSIDIRPSPYQIQQSTRDFTWGKISRAGRRLCVFTLNTGISG